MTRARIGIALLLFSTLYPIGIISQMFLPFDRTDAWSYRDWRIIVLAGFVAYPASLPLVWRASLSWWVRIPLIVNGVFFETTILVFAYFWFGGPVPTLNKASLP